jgi:flagellar protein FlaG
MVDQVSPLGSLALGLPQVQLAAAKSQPTPEPTRPAKPAPSAPADPETKLTTDSAKTPEEAMKQVNAYLQQSESDLKMHVDKATGRTIFQVVSNSTGEVLLQMPSEEVLSMARKLTALSKEKGASGVLVDKEG